MATFAIKCGGGKMGFSISRDGGSATIGAFITDAADEAAAYACAGANVPSSFLGFHLEDYTVSENSEGIWDVEASYSPIDHNQMILAFDTSGGTQTITQSFSTVNTYVNGDPVINFKGAIRPNDYGVEGCEIAVPVLSFSETHYFPAASPPSLAALFGVTGKVNSDGFREFAAGEVLFLGASGSQQGAEDWQIDYSFAGMPNETDLTVGDINGITKRGWDYLWVYYANVQDNIGKVIRRIPRQVNIEQVYKYTAFSALGI